MIKYFNKIIVSILTLAILVTITVQNPNELLSVHAQEYGEYYGEKINSINDKQEKNLTKENIKAPELKSVEKTSYDYLLLDGYEEDISQRDESLKVFVKGDEEKRLYFLSPIHILKDGKWKEVNEENSTLKNSIFSFDFLNKKKDYISLSNEREELVKFDSKQFDSTQVSALGFKATKKINSNEAIPFELEQGISVALNENNTSVILKKEDDILGYINLNISDEKFAGTAFTPTLGLEAYGDNIYGISLELGEEQKTRSFNVDLEAIRTVKYDSSSVFLFGVRSGGNFKDNSYNPGGYQNITNAVVGNADYNNGYIFCTDECVVESRNNYGIISFYNNQSLSSIIGDKREVKDAKLVMYYGTNQKANDGKGMRMSALMLDPSKNFDVANANNITYTNFQRYLNNSNSKMIGSTIVEGYSGEVTLDITSALQSWENSGNHHAIMLRGESKKDGSRY